MSLKSVKTFTEEFKSRYSHLHILINNAGVMVCPFGLSEDGIETQFATNHVAHFHLTTLLLPELERSTPSRIVNVSAAGHMYPFGKLDLENISDPAKYDRFIHYFKTKVPYGSLGTPRGVASSETAPKELWEFTENLLADKIPCYERVSL